MVAERAAWDYVKNNSVNYQLITLCPGMVFGKMIHPISSLSQLNVSNQIVWDVLKAGRDGEIPITKAPGKALFPRIIQARILKYSAVWVDVEDLAEVCRKSLLFQATGHERFLVTSLSYDTQEIADIIRIQLPEKSQVPTGKPGARIADTHYSCDASKVHAVLGVKFRGLEESIVPLAEQLYDMDG